MDDKDASKPDRKRLFELASEQAGYFTTEQAASCGYGKALLSYHAGQRTFVRVGRGLYRLSEYPSSPHEEVMAAWLAAGGKGAVVSHESALDLLDLADVIPKAVHITIPRRERWRRAPDGAILHTAISPIPKSQVRVMEGIPVTSAARTIIDSAASGLGHEQVFAAIEGALGRGLTTQKELLRLARGRGGQVEKLVKQGIEKVAA